MEVTLGQLAGFLNGLLENGAPGHKVNGLKGLEEAGASDVSFLANPKYAKLLGQTRAGAVLVRRDEKVPQGLPVIRVADPYLAYAKLLTFASAPPPRPPLGVHPQAVVAPSAQLGEGVSVHPLAYVGEKARLGARVVIHPGAYVGDEAQVGDDSVIHPRAVVEAGCIIGRRCIIHSGAVIGADGFGFAPEEDGSYYKIPQLGIVQLDDDVEVGANAAIDRAALGRTWIQRGVKIDNLVQIAHNCVIGEHTAMAAQCGLAGSCKVGKGVVMGGQAGLAGHIEIGDKVQIAAQSGILSSLPAGAAVMGSPSMPLKLFFKSTALIRRLPEFAERVRKLEKKLEKLAGEQQ